MKKLSSALLAAALIAAPMIGFAAPATAGTDKIDICHATGNGKYIPASISRDGTANGHAGHQDGADIIPAYSWVEDGVRRYFDGQNLDKAALIGAGCATGPEQVTARPVPPRYIPASCARPALPYGEVIVPEQLGGAVASSSAPALNGDKTAWTVQYALFPDTADTDFSWPAGTDGSYTFAVVPLSADPAWVTDSRTGAGSCELPDTGAEAWMLPATLAGGVLIIGGAYLFRRFAN